MVAKQFSHHHDDQHGEGDAAADETPLVGTYPVGGGFREFWRPAEHRFKSTAPRIQQGLFVGHHELQKNAVIVRYFHVQHTGLPANDAVEPLDGNAVSLSNR